MNNREGLLHQANESIRRAKKEYNNAVSENFYKVAISNLLKMSPPDNKLLARTYYDLSYRLFNNNKESESAEYLEKAIKVIDQQLLKNDEDYRLLLLCNFALSDTLTVILKDGTAALQKSYQAFIAIKEKTQEEKELGDPFRNPEKFCDYYNRKTCSTSYRQGSKHETNQILLSEIPNYRLFSDFTDLTCKKTTKKDDKTFDMMSKISLDSKSQSFISIQEINQNAQYRQFAVETVQIAFNILNNNETYFLYGLPIKNKQQTCIDLYDRALAALNSITQKSTEDEKLKQQIEIQKQSLLDFMNTKPIPNSTFSYATSNLTLHRSIENDNIFETDNNNIKEKELIYKPDRMEM